MSKLLVAVLTGLVALCAGLYLGGHPELLPEKLQDVFVDQDVSLQAEAAQTIEDNFINPVPEEKLSNASIKGMVRSLRSRFSAYFTPEENKLFQESTNGSFSGVGMTVVEAKRGLRVVMTFPGSPAKRANIVPGDLIVAVNGKSIAGEPSNVATARIKGPAGTKVELTVVHEGKRRDVTLERKAIKVPVVAGKLRTVNGRKLGVIGIASFTSGVHAAVREQVEKLEKRGAQGFVVDLRGDGGGLLDEAVLVSSVFIPNGTIVSTKGRTKPEQTYDATGDPATKKPAVVLVDKGTASASEIVTAALEQRYDAPVVGQRTFGKGVFGQLYPLSNGGALDLIVGKYYTPDGSNINGLGIKPTVPLSKATNANPQKALDRALQVLNAKVAKDQAKAGAAAR